MDISENIILNDASSTEWPPFFIKCELCDFETMKMQELRKHIADKNHQQKEIDEKRENLGWFWYFGKISEHLLS